jgi:hypothetical protein
MSSVVTSWRWNVALALKFLAKRTTCSSTVAVASYEISEFNLGMSVLMTAFV